MSDWTITGATDYTVPGLTIPEAQMSFGMSMSFATAVAENGVYEVLLTFLEPNASGPGVRMFSVAINDAPVLQNIDLFAEAGLQQVFRRAAWIVVVDGQVRVDLRSTSGRPAVISNISIVRM